jgi:hypothetical protein
MMCRTTQLSSTKIRKADFGPRFHLSLAAILREKNLKTRLTLRIARDAGIDI